MSCATLSNLPLPPENRNGWPWTEESSQLPATMTDGLPWPKITIVTPSFNQGQFIEETIRSVLLQGYPNLEYIIIDGGSTDDTVQMIEKYEPWLTYWTSEPDRGQADAVNKGFYRATGKIIGWLNSDDLYCQESLTAVANSFTQHLQSLLFYGDCASIDKLSHLVHIKYLANFDLPTLLKGKNMGQPAVFFHQRVLEEIGYLNERLHYALDFEFFLRIWYYTVSENTLEKDKACIYISEILAKSRLWEGSKTINQAICFGKEYEEVLDRFFQQQDLPRKLEKLKGHAYTGSVYLRQASLLWRQGEGKKARDYYLYAVRKAPNLKVIVYALRCWLLTFIKIKLDG